MKAKWTTEAPTVEGWYWAYEDYEDAYTIEMVQVVVIAREESFTIFALSTEHNGRQSLEYWDAWLGPIKVPSLPIGFDFHDPSRERDD